MLVMLDETFETLFMSCETSSHVRVSAAQVVRILAQVSPIDTFEVFTSDELGFEVLVMGMVVKSRH